MLCLFAHHRAASSWANDILRELAFSGGWKHRVLHNESMFNHDLAGYINIQQPDLLCLSNSKSAYLNEIDNFVGIHLVRDPRDILISSYYSHRNSHPVGEWTALETHRKELQAVPLEQGLYLEMEFRHEQFRDMLDWDYNHPSVYEVKMEELTQNPLPHLSKVLSDWQRLQSTVSPAQRFSGILQRKLNRVLNTIERQLQLPVTLPRLTSSKIGIEQLQRAISKNTYEKKSHGRKTGELNNQHHYRSGVPGSWRDLLTPDHKQYFKEHHGQLLIKLGYEENNDW
ncbi:MAG: hypothetical protein ACWA5Q_04865 [bacterium]